MPAYALVFMLFTMASSACRAQRLRRRVPGHRRRLGGEPLGRLSAATGMVLGAGYMLWLYRRVIFGKITARTSGALLDLSPREYVVFAPLIVLTLWMGVYPSASSPSSKPRSPAGASATKPRWTAQRATGGRCKPMTWTLALPELVLGCLRPRAAAARRASREAGDRLPGHHGRRRRAAAAGRAGARPAPKARLRRPLRRRMPSAAS